MTKSGLDDLLDRLCSTYQVYESPGLRNAWRDAMADLHDGPVMVALAEVIKGSAKPPRPADVREAVFRQRVNTSARKQQEQGPEPLDKAEAAQIVKHLKQRIKSSWHPSDAGQRAAANLFHDLMHATDLSLPDEHRPKVPPMDAAALACFHSFGGAAGFRELTAQTVLDARRAFCADLVGRWMAG